MERDELVRTLGRYFGGRPEVVAAWLFGSHARGTSHAASDVDVAVLLRDGAPDSLADVDFVSDLQMDLEEVLRRDVDVVAANGAAPDFLFRVLRDGVLYESDHERRILFEVAARNEYWDLLPILDLYRRTVLRGA